MKLKCADRLIDCSTWVGNWAFYYLKYGKISLLKTRLIKYNIIKAYVSPIEAILEQDPTRANLNLYEMLDNMDNEFFSPVPVVDLSFSNWEEIVENAITRSDVKMLKVIPNYHMYFFDEAKLGKLVEHTLKHNLIISIQMRIEDPRRHHPLMKVPDVDIINILKVVSFFPEQKFILCNIHRDGAKEALYFLNNIYIDTASLDSQDILTHLCNKYNSKKILFSTHSAFYSPEPNIFKICYSKLNNEDINNIAYRNAENLFGKSINI
jgi:predicted TIM-barrel fold metal-dependent hydrolase